MNESQKSVFDILKMIQVVLAFWKLNLPLRQIKLFYCNGPRAFFPLALTSIWNRGILNLHLHFIPQNPGWKNRLGLRLMSKLANKVIVCSNHLKIKLKAILPSSESSKVFVLSNTLSTAQANSTDDNIAMASRNVAMVGRITPVKRHDAFLNLARSFPKIQFFCVGDAEPQHHAYAENLKQEAPPNLQFLGYQPDPFRVLGKLGVRILITPSDYETFGLSAIEAMARGFVTLVRATGGLEEIAFHTGALSFKTNEELLRLFENLQNLPEKTFADIARSQQTQTRLQYSPLKFHESFVELLNSQEILQ